MKFKDGYREFNENIAPDSRFIDKLADDMNHKKRSRIQLLRTRMIMSASAACMCIAVSAVILLSGALNGGENISISGNEAPETTSTSVSGMFALKKWYDSSMSADEIYDVFIKRLGDDADLNKLYCSNNTIFGDDSIIGVTETEILIQAISGAEYTDKSDYGGSCNYYMAVFENGDIIKFEVYDSGYVILNDIEGCYKK